MSDLTASSNLQHPVLIIQPTKGWGRLGLHEVWEYRDLLYFLLWRDVKGRYKQMALGPLWIVLRPLFNMMFHTDLQHGGQTPLRRHPLSNFQLQRAVALFNWRSLLFSPHRTYERGHCFKRRLPAKHAKQAKEAL